ncbi:MAG: glycosyltransferase family 2 protein [Proteobacteria bacterium]|nr:glycosyltransferase family 2 protein [Pseudomonadota bacterium]MBU1419480.1 glycosyltransferase family 2 protein [Pseudomonadota bacterium]MBU1455171.1 glycosyltransferase family 2 protein [Pseudomonadota bacterium]
MKKSISVVMPVYNEVATISRTIKECSTEILAHFSCGEIIVVDDESTDGSLEVLKSLSKEVADLTVLYNSHNLGHGPSLMRAIEAATGDYIFCIDSDYQHLPGEFWNLFPGIEHADVVIGLRVKRQDPLHRKVLSRLANTLIRLIFDCTNKDLNVPFKLFKRTDLQAILPLIPQNAYIPSTLAVLAAHKSGLSVWQVPVTHLPRNSGTSSFLGWHLLFFCSQVLWELLSFRMKQWNKIPPLRSEL